MPPSRRGRRIDDPFGGAPGKKAGAKASAPSGASAASRKAPPAKAASGEAPDPFVGKVVGRCKIEARIGAGKTSIVYRAMHTGLNRLVAVKILQPAVLKYPEVVAKFDEEARAVARLDQENILKIYDVVTEGDVHGIVMELLEGESLLDVLSHEERLTPTDAMRVVRQAASGLVAAHRKNIIHRDVKPQNLVLLPDGTVKVVDFGLATEANSDLAAVRIGTPHFMAPEVCQAKPAETKSDVYSLGITLYHLLVGQPPYAGQTIKEILASHVEGRPLSPERVQGVPKALGDLVREMTKRDPLTRISMEDVIESLDRIGGAELESRPTIRPRRGGRRRRAATNPVFVLIAIGAAVAVAAVALLASKGGGDGPSNGKRPGVDVGVPPEVVDPPVVDTGMGSSPGTTPPAMATAPPQETEASRKAREELQARIFADSIRAESEKAYAEADGYARDHWEDKAAVVQRYRALGQRYAVTDAGKRAARRADAIERGDEHPHPERSYSARDKVAEAQRAWATATGAFEVALSQFRYADALAMVPAEVQDPDGQLGPELAFWRTLAKDLMEFLQVLEREVMTLPEATRTVRLATGSAKILQSYEIGLLVRDDRGDRKVLWADVPLDSLALLTAKSFVGKGSRPASLLASFAFAHKRRDNFFKAVMVAQGSGDLANPAQEQLDRLYKRAEERFGK